MKIFAALASSVACLLVAATTAGAQTPAAKLLPAQSEIAFQV